MKKARFIKVLIKTRRRQIVVNEKYTIRLRGEKEEETVKKTKTIIRGRKVRKEKKKKKVSGGDRGVIAKLKNVRPRAESITQLIILLKKKKKKT